MKETYKESDPMKLPAEVKELIPKVPFVPITTVSREGEPHLIVVGAVKDVREDDVVVFEIYKMSITQNNLNKTGTMQVAIATKEGGPKGYRLEGKGCVEGKEVLMKVEKVEQLI